MLVGKELIDSLLCESESASLDFKRDQYDLHSDKGKREFLKDLLTFANSWRRTDAYILLGVKETPDGKREVTGIAEHLDEATMQQIAGAKTNTPILFSYRPVEYHDVQIGVLHIPIQPRPVFLRKDHGTDLKAGAVYIRRGSATVEADPDEIKKMGVAEATEARATPLLSVEFGDREARKPFGTTLAATLKVLRPPPGPEIPDMDTGRPLVSFGMNSDYFRDVADYVLQQSAICSAGFAFRNAGAAAARGVALDMLVETPRDDIEFLVDGDVLPVPSTSTIGGMRTVMGAMREDDVEVERLGEGRWHVSAKVATIQPMRVAWTTTKLWVVAPGGFDADVEARIYAENLQAPVTQALSFRIAASVTPVSLQAVFELARKFDA